jgi:hypothetical protein
MNYGRPQDLSLQSIFDTVSRHLLTQGKRSIDSDENGQTRCRYRGENGLACAVGCLLTDEEAKEVDRPKDATGGSATWISIHLWPQFKDLAHAVDLLQSLQSVHDKKPVHDWPLGLTQVAHKYDLNPRTPEFWRDNHAG